MTLDDALLDLDVAIRAILLHRPRRRQQAVLRAVRAVTAAARGEAAGAVLPTDEDLRRALERCAAEHGWSETMLIVNAAARRLAGPPMRRAG